MADAFLAPLAQSLSRGAMRAGSIAAEIEVVLAGAGLLALVGLLLAREVRRSRTRSKPVSDEARARAMMGELCPAGWRAQINLVGGGEDAVEGYGGARPGVTVEWSELGEALGESPPLQRLHADTIADGLAAMVDARRADEVLERIERSARGDDDPWDAS